LPTIALALNSDQDTVVRFVISGDNWSADTAVTQVTVRLAVEGRTFEKILEPEPELQVPILRLPNL
jgi:hypothetical protein